MALRRQCLVPVVLQRYQQLVRELSCTRNENQGTHKSRGGRQEQQHIQAEANAYDVLGLPQSCSEARIRATFRKLAKATHPDLQTDTSTAHFIRILAAYEILSDPAKRAEYDKHLRSNLRSDKPWMNASQTEETAGFGSGGFNSSGLYEQDRATTSTEVVGWLRGYRAMVRDVVNRREIGVGKGWEEELRGEVQSALKRAYFGPPVSEREGLPECFEAEERAQTNVEDVLHLVSGRQLFGLVRQVQNPALEGQQDTQVLLQANALENKCDQRAPELANIGRVSPTDEASDFIRRYHSFTADDLPKAAVYKAGERTSYVDLELQLFGNVVARSIRVPFKIDSNSDTPTSESNDEQDCIYIYLSSEQVEDVIGFVNGTVADENKFSKILLGTIRGLSSTGIRNSCFAYAPDGKRTHLILQHTTPLVKHMQWFRVGEESAACECRCRRASILPSRYWLFEPRTDTHNVGGWYIERFFQNGRSCKTRNQSRHEPLKQHGSTNREFISTSEEQSDKLSDLLHPAMYIMAAAYKTLDEEDKAARRREASIPNRIKKLMDLRQITSGIAHWWNHKWNPSTFVQMEHSSASVDDKLKPEDHDSEVQLLDESHF